MSQSPVNVADRLTEIARGMPAAMAIVHARRGGYATCSFAELASDTEALARGLVDMGVQPQHRIVLLVKPGVEFVKLVFALLRTGATTVLIDPGMGRKHLINCLAAAEPDGFVAVSAAQAARVAYRSRFPRAQLNVTIGRRWFWGGVTYSQLLRRGRTSSARTPVTMADEPAAIIFTSGSTGPPKGVLYTHRMFDAQASEIQRAYDLQPGGVDLACFALFGLFNSALGVTTVFPEMNFSRPASAAPEKLLAAANAWQATQAFASPAVWDKLSRHCKASGETIPTLRKVFSCGAPVPASVLERTLRMVHPEAEMHTPYGATEALPVATIAAAEVLSDTARRTSDGAGVCVGCKFDSIEWLVIGISDGPIQAMEQVEELPAGEIGELIVRGPQVSPRYVVGDERANAGSKILDGETVWHRMGDVGYFDAEDRFWYCGRKAQRVETRHGTLFTECVEAVFTAHPRVRRCALVGVGEDAGGKTPVIVYEAELPREIYPDPKFPDAPHMPSQLAALIPAELAEIAAQHAHTSRIKIFLRHRRLPVDVRHNAKIDREALAEWAAEQLKKARGRDAAASGALE